jgi:hypothetical protein
MTEELERMRAAIAEQRRLLREQIRIRAEVVEQVRLIRILAAETRRLVRKMPAVVIVRRLPALSCN